MRTFFQLVDDVHVPGRWHLGDVFANGQDISDELLATEPLDLSAKLTGEISHPGRPLEFSLTYMAVPVVTNALGNAIAEISAKDVQRLPLSGEHLDGLEVLNPLQMVQCIDESRCDTVKWTKRDHRADLAGEYRMVIGLRIDPAAVPENVDIFRVEGWRIALVVSERMKLAMERVSCFGAKFELATGDSDPFVLEHWARRTRSDKH